MTKICKHCGEATGYRRVVISVAVLPGEEGEAEEKAIKALSTRERAEAALAWVERKEKDDIIRY